MQRQKKTNRLLFSLLSGLAFTFGLVSVAAGLDTGNWLPVDPGNSWTYRLSTGLTSTEYVAATNVPVNGISTVKLVAGNGETSYETHDANGHRLHRLVITEYYPELGQNLTVTTTFQPAALMLPAQVTLGQNVRSSGNVTMNLAGYGSFALNYSINATVRALETLNIRGSDVSAYKADYTIVISGTVNGQYLSVSETATAWYQPEVGTVKWIVVVDGEQSSGTLISTNVVSPVVENPDVLASVTALPLHGLAGDNFRIIMQAVNSGPGNASNVTMQGTWPPGMQYIGIGGDNSSCSNSASGFSCLWSSLAEGAVRKIELLMNGPSEGDYSYDVTVSIDQNDTDLANNSDHLTLHINQPSPHTGDISPRNNPDGQITISDALQALRYALQIDSPPDNAVLQHGDVAPLSNGMPVPDGRISLLDALTILRKALGLVNY